MSDRPDGIGGTEVRAGLPIIGFADGDAFAAWLSQAPRTSGGVWAKLAKKGAPTAGLSRADAVDAALCHGWIDGQQDRYDRDHWLVRFTPRRRASRWSQVNRTRALELVADDRMQPAGSVEIEAARADGRWNAAYAPASTATAPSDLRAALDAAPGAGAFFATLKGAKRYAILYQLDALKRPETRARRIAELVALFEAGRATRD